MRTVQWLLGIAMVIVVFMSCVGVVALLVGGTVSEETSEKVVLGFSPEGRNL
jgi:hypothetical protein